MDAIRLLVVDDYAVVRHGLRRYFSVTPGLELVAEASNGPEALALAAAHAPDVVLLDVMMPGMDGLATAAALRQSRPNLAILMLTTFCTRETILAALQAGVSGFLLKDIDIDELATAIRAVHAGQIYLQAGAVQQLKRPAPTPGAPPLTARERQIGELIAEGLSNKAIAAELGISAKTASVHVSNLMAKLGLRSRTQVAYYMLQGQAPRA